MPYIAPGPRPRMRRWTVMPATTSADGWPGTRWVRIATAWPRRTRLLARLWAWCSAPPAGRSIGPAHMRMRIESGMVVGAAMVPVRGHGEDLNERASPQDLLKGVDRPLHPPAERKAAGGVGVAAPGLQTHSAETRPGEQTAKRPGGKEVGVGRGHL